VNGCDGKKKYSSQALAEEVAGAYAGGSGRRRRWTYCCDACGCWHVTSMSPQKHAAIMAARARRAGSAW